MASLATTSAPTMLANPFALSPLETHLFQFLLKATPSTCTPRVAGGWVRDKLLGQASHDIDIALDVFTGEEYAELILKHIVDNDLDVNRDPNDASNADSKEGDGAPNSSKKPSPTTAVPPR